MRIFRAGCSGGEVGPSIDTTGGVEGAVVDGAGAGAAASIRAARRVCMPWVSCSPRARPGPMMPAPLLLAALAAAPATFRLDYFHTGDAHEERFSLDRVVVEPLPWP